VAPQVRAVFVALLFLAGCKRELPECRERCVEKLGGSSQMCTDVCTKTCADLEKRYGIPQDQCWSIQHPPERR
jgi:hypothetical protein